MGGIVSIVASIFGVFWTIIAASMGVSVFLPLFGVVFIVLGIVQAVYHFKNATGRNRFSTFDITDSDEEPDLLNQYFNGGNSKKSQNSDTNKSKKSNFCPYCGGKIESDFIFCKQCGKKIT